MDKPRRIAITGASGFIGKALGVHLVALGHEVIALSRSGSRVRGVRNQIIGSYLTPGVLEEPLNGVDTVVHLAARAHQPAAGTAADFAANQQIAQAVVQACVRTKVQRLVLISSAGIHGHRTIGKPLTEDDAPAPAEPYAYSKLQCEQLVRSTLVAPDSLEWVIVRPPLVYGDGAPGNFARLLTVLRSGLPIPLACVDNRRSLLALDNLLDFITLCTWHLEARNQAFLVADGEDLSTPDLLRRTARAMNLACRLWPMPPSLLEIGARVAGRQALWLRLCASLQLDIGKARARLGWAPPISVDEGLRRAVRGLTP